MFVSNQRPQISSRYEADRIMQKYPDRIPVIVHRNPKSTNTPEIDKSKFLVPTDLTVGQMMYVIRKRIHLHPEKALFLFVNQEIVCNSHLIIAVYERSHNPTDGFLHITYSCENTFGAGGGTSLL